MRVQYQQFGSSSAVSETQESNSARSICKTKPNWETLLVGSGRAMSQVKELIGLVAPRRATVLITGATGTGKELIARSLHQASDRWNQRMVAVNCAALPDTLLESELFGHTKGAFTGAANARRGCFEEANHGTIFLDEIGEMPLDLQAKLLRVLQEREFQRLGSSETVKIDVRVIAATNVDLLDQVRRKKFREDLYYRLNVVQIRTPQLIERIEDIPELVTHLTNRICKQEHLHPKQIHPCCLQMLAQHTWPGNVRELEHALERAVAVSGDRTTLLEEDFAIAQPYDGGYEELQENVSIPSSGMNLDRAMEDFQRMLFERALRMAGGNKQHAADLLGIKRTTMISRVKAMTCAA